MRRLKFAQHAWPSLRAKSERAGVNHCIQGSAADIAMGAMLQLEFNSPRLREIGWAQLLQVHDEFILEGPEEHAEEAADIVREAMENPFRWHAPNFKMKVPLCVDYGIGKSWTDAKP